MTRTLKQTLAFFSLVTLLLVSVPLRGGAAAAHDFQLVQTEPATCTADGARLFVCADCGETRTETIPALGHDFSEDWTVDRPATCTEDGQKSRHCTRCNAVTDVLRLRATGHETVTTVVPPTCADRGYTHHVCSVCGVAWDDQYVPPAGHTPGLWVVDSEPTCEAQGLRHRSCTVCGVLMEQATIAALGHIDTDRVVLPTCTERGYTLHTCRRCGRQTQTKFVAATGHSFPETGVRILEPTCTDKGSERVVCTVCGAAETRAVPALGHDYGNNWVIDREPTCTAKGEKSLHCRRCGARKSVTALDRTPHIEVYDISVAPTCTEPGKASGSHCAVCGAVLSAAQTLPPTGHSYAVTAVLEPATCTTRGSEALTCTACGAQTTRATAALGHALSGWVVDKAPTCTAKGEQSQHCDRCGKRFNVTELPRTDHTPVKDSGKKPTCTEPGVTAGKHCKVCGKVLKAQKTIPATGHTLKTKFVPAGVGKAGARKTVCTVCRAVTEKKVIPAVQSVALSKTAYVFDGSAKTPKVAVTDAEGTKLKQGRDFTVTYARGRKAIGLYAVKVTLCGDYSGEVTRRFKIVPKQPTGLTFSSKQSCIVLGWNEVPGAGGYRVLEYHADTGKYTAVGTTKKLYCKVKNLLPGEKHTYVVRAFAKKDGRLFWSAPSAQKVTATRPVKPTVHVGANGTNGVLSWNDCGDCVYAVYVSNRANGSYVCLGTTDGRIFVTPAYTSGKTVYFKVRALVRNGTTDLCGTSSAVTAFTF